jgi:hypothetical protein
VFALCLDYTYRIYLIMYFIPGKCWVAVQNEAEGFMHT